MSIAGAGGTYIYSQTLSAGQPSFLSQSIIIFNPSTSTYITTSGTNSNAGGNSSNTANSNSNAGGNSGGLTSSITINSGRIAEVKIATRYGTKCSLFIPPTNNLIVDLEVQSVISYDGCYITFFQ